MIDIIKRKQAEADLTIANEKAEESSRMKSSLLLNLNHEFRTPMNSILGFSQILRESIADNDVKNLAGHFLPISTIFTTKPYICYS